MLFETGWFGWVPRFDRDALLPAVSCWVVRVSWVRGHMRDAILTVVPGATR